MTKMKFCLIINNQDFLNKIESLPGNKFDAERLNKEFRKLGFRVNELKNKNADEIREIFKNLSENKYSFEATNPKVKTKIIKILSNKLSVLVCVILSHGNEGFFVGNDGGNVQLDEIFSYFENEEFIGKPIVFFINACRGNKSNQGLPNLEAGGSIKVEDNSNEFLSGRADVLIGYATIYGYPSCSIDEKGSLYIQELCDELEKFGSSKDLVSILTEVNFQVAKNYKISENDPKTKKESKNLVQTPIYTSTLRMDLFLNKEIKQIGWSCKLM